MEINTCPKCGKTYDDTWKQCLTCSILLKKGTIEVKLTQPAKAGEIVCPNLACRYVGKPEKQSKRHRPTAIFLFLLGIIPGLMYLYFTEGDNYVCPKCGRILDEEDLLKSKEWL
jgi:hypothetical protein